MSELEGSVNYMWSNCLIIMMKKLSPREGEVCPSLPWQGLHCTVSVCPSYCYQTFKTASKTATWAVPGCLCPVATYRQGLFNEKREQRVGLRGAKLLIPRMPFPRASHIVLEHPRVAALYGFLFPDSFYCLARETLVVVPVSHFL